MLNGTINHIESTTLASRIHDLEAQGYDQNLVAKGDHFTCYDGKVKLYPQDFCVDEIIRFDNATDPGDQAILYAISSDSKNVRGLFVESYGIYNESLSSELIKRIQTCETYNRKKYVPEETSWREEKPTP